MPSDTGAGGPLGSGVEGPSEELVVPHLSF